MKKTISLLLALVLCLGLCACDGGNDIPETTETPTEAVTEPASIVYQIGEAASTDIVEVVLKDVSYTNKTVTFTTEDGYTLVMLKYSIQNIGKTDLGFFTTVKGHETANPALIVWVDYDDGYIFHARETKGADGETYDSSVFQDPDDIYLGSLKPLSEAVDFEVAICVPNQVVEDTDAPLLVKFNLLDSTGENIVVSYSVR